MNDLVAYLRARLGEEAAAARDATQGGWSWFPDPRPKTGSALHGDRGVTVLLTTVHDLDRADAAHIAYWDPMRVLADITAKLAVISICQTPDPHTPREVMEGACAECAVLYAIAKPYAGREDFSDEWRMP